MMVIIVKPYSTCAHTYMYYFTITYTHHLYICSFALSSTPPVARVGLEQTFFRVSEDVGVVELCARVYFPVIECPIAFSFDVRLSTRDGTAGKRDIHVNCIYAFSHYQHCLLYMYIT